MARNTLRLDTSGFSDALKMLDSIDNVQRVVDDALGTVAKKIETDTKSALSSANLPARGKYSTGKTNESVVTDGRVHWEGQVAWIPVGFDFSKVGAGGYLISGTPRMMPDKALNRMYKGKKYMKEIQAILADKVLDYVIGGQ